MKNTLKENQKKGLYGKYIIQKADGSPVDPDAKYFILRYDKGGSDHKHIRACRNALRIYAADISNHLPELSKDLKAILEKISGDLNFSSLQH